MYRTIYLKILLLLISLTTSHCLFAQNRTRVRGVIKDKQTGEVMPFTNVMFVGTTIGAISDTKGVYFLNTTNPVDSIKFSFIGYSNLTVPVKRGVYNEINVYLEPEGMALDEIVVKAGENPAYRIMRNILKNKKRNNPNNVVSYKCEFYNKINISAYNINDKLLKKIFKKDTSLIQKLDTSEISGKPCLPIYFSETFSDYWHRKNPIQKKEIIKSYKSNSIGIDQLDVKDYTGNVSIKMNLYDSYIMLFKKSFTGPLAVTWKLNYKYYLIDSAYINNKYCYHIKFIPRRKFENTFVGDFWVHDTTFAIVKIKVRVSETANLNFANDLQIEQEFTQLNDSVWFMTKSKNYVDFNLIDKRSGVTSMIGIIGQKTLIYSNIVINPKIPKRFFEGNITVDSTEFYLKKKKINWDTKRPEQLTIKEKEINKTIDVVNQSPIVKQTERIVRMFSGGYYNLGKFEIGPYFKLYSFNPIEGNRFVFSGRTAKEFKDNMMIGGYIGYGTKDKEFKGGIDFGYMFKKYPRFAMGVSLTHDIGQLGRNKKILFLRENRILTSEDNFISSLLRRRTNFKLSMINEFEYYIEKEWFRGFKNMFYVTYNRTYSADSLPFYKYSESTSEFNTFSEEYISFVEFTLNTRISFQEDIMDFYFRRISIRTPYPIFYVNLTYGFHDLYKKNNDYYKFNLIVKQNLDLKSLGRLKYVIDCGYISKKTPFTALELHKGNETWSYYNYAFNMLNYYEFISDSYINIYADHHFDGLILGKIPLLRRMQMRSTVSGRALYGTLAESNKKILKFPDETNPVSHPYFEASVGVENIFKMFRVEAVWRLDYLNHPNISPFGIRAKMHISL